MPITFLDKYCPTQFEIVGLTSSSKENTYGQLLEDTTTRAMICGNKKYARITLKFKYSNMKDLCSSSADFFRRICETAEIKTERRSKSVKRLFMIFLVRFFFYKGINLV